MTGFGKNMLFFIYTAKNVKNFCQNYGEISKKGLHNEKFNFTKIFCRYLNQPRSVKVWSYADYNIEL